MPIESLHDTDPLQAALRGLPLPTPPRDGWPRLQAELLRRRRTRRARFALAAAASLLLAIALAATLRPLPSISPDVTAPLTAADADVLAPLIAESARLEAWLAQAGDDGMAATTVALDASLADRLHLIDRLLAEPGTDAATREVLWWQRVTLLRDQVALSAGELRFALHEGAPPAPLMF